MSSIFGIGTDLVLIDRIEKAILNPSFVKKCFTASESVAPPRTLAGFFAAKEAAAKSLGKGFRDFYPCDIEIIKNALGKPFILLHGNARKSADALNVTSIILSISHENNYALAFTVAICD